MKAAKSDYFLLEKLNEELKKLRETATRINAELNTVDLSAFLNDFDDLCVNDFLPVFTRYEQDAQEGAYTAFEDRQDYFART